jgi:hypothetical protein
MADCTSQILKDQRGARFGKEYDMVDGREGEVRHAPSFVYSRMGQSRTEVTPASQMEQAIYITNAKFETESR